MAASQQAKKLENFRIDPVDHARLRKAAAERGKPFTVLIREVVTRWLDQQDIEAERRQRDAA
ncbi:MAG: hypothetical protein ACKO7W_17920 [Elainella sp.]